MGHFAHIDNGIVTAVICIDNKVLGEDTLTFPDTEGAGRAFIANTLGLTGEYRQTSYNGNFRGRFAGVGYRYDEATDEFVPPGWEYIDGEWQDPNPPTEPESV